MAYANANPDPLAARVDALTTSPQSLADELTAARREAAEAKAVAATIQAAEKYRKSKAAYKLPGETDELFDLRLGLEAVPMRPLASRLPFWPPNADQPDMDTDAGRYRVNTGPYGYQQTEWAQMLRASQAPGAVYESLADAMTDATYVSAAQYYLADATGIALRK